MNYTLMYRDIPVIQFNIAECTADICHYSFLPISVQLLKDPFDMIRSFCEDRILMMNRKYCKELLDTCQIDNQSAIGICIISKALSFRDNYWIKKANDDLTWNDVNLYHNEFSEDISYTALTGEIKNIHIDDGLYTGELTNKGTRAKCFFRENNCIYLAKAETNVEIFSEIIVSKLAEKLRLPCTKYVFSKKYEKNVSICKIDTNNNIELIPARDILNKYNQTKMGIDTDFYNAFMTYDAINFLKMQVFDYITLNTDRNRDNFGLKKENGKITGLYPIFDHDSCFKGVSSKAHYFVTGISFEDTLLHFAHCSELPKIKNELISLSHYVKTEEWKNLLLKIKDEAYYEDMMIRTNNLLNLLEKQNPYNHYI